jgi:uncharacterized membrane protein
LLRLCFNVAMPVSLNLIWQAVSLLLDAADGQNTFATIALITSLTTSISMSFVALTLNYGFQTDFAVRWLKAAATRYVVIVLLLMIVIPPIQRFVMRQAGLPTR